MAGIVLHCHSYQWVSISQDKKTLASLSLLEESSKSDQGWGDWPYAGLSLLKV